MSLLETLPLELFEDVFANVTYFHDLLTLRAINKFFNRRFTPVVFHSLSFRNTTASASRLANIASSPLALCVREFSINLDLPWGNNRSTGNSKQMEDLPRQGCAGSFLNLQSMTLRLPNRHCTDEHRSRVRDVVLNAFQSTTITPTSLTVNCLLRTDNYTSHPEFRRFLSRVKHLSLDISDWVWLPDSPGIVFEGWLHPVQENLESLSLESTSWAPLFPNGLQFSKLKKLKLRSFIFSRHNPCPLKSMILSDSVASSLEELVLGGCEMCLHDADDKNTWADFIRTVGSRLMVLKLFDIIAPLSYIQLGSVNRILSPSTWATYLDDLNAANDVWEALGQMNKVNRLNAPYPHSFRSGYLEWEAAVGLQASGVFAHPGRESLLETFDFDSFLNTDVDQPNTDLLPTPLELVL